MPILSCKVIRYLQTRIHGGVQIAIVSTQLARFSVNTQAVGRFFLKITAISISKAITKYDADVYERCDSNISLLIKTNQQIILAEKLYGGLLVSIITC